MKRVSFYTFGCRLNQSETAVLQNNFEHYRYRVVDFKEPADYVVVNTCTVTENGDADTRRLVNKINRLNPKAQIALIGCQAQIQKERLSTLPNVRYVVGNAVKMDLPSILKEFENNEKPQVIAPTITKETFTLPIAGIDRRHTRANLKIQDGCDFFCSFCEIPYARGRARSREFNDIIKEAKTLAAAGHQELVLTGINIGTYQEGDKTFLDVIDALEKIKGLRRIRISSIEPTTIPHRLLSEMAKNKKLCRHLHIPLQSGSDKILEKMKRKYTLKQFDQFIQNAYKKIEGLCLGTDVIVGFPGETDDDFKKTFDYLKTSPFAYFHVFSYSARHLAKSKDADDPVEIKTIKNRSACLRDLSRRKRQVFNAQFIGSQQDVLFENQKTGLWYGLTDNYIRVAVAQENGAANNLKKITLKKCSIVQ